MRTLVGLALATSMVLGAGCGDKKPVESTAAPAAAKITAEMPDTAYAKAFAKRLVALSIEDWKPIDASSGADLNYKTLAFSPDGTWNAEALLTASYEEFDCKEHGTWRIDNTDSSETATMDWELVKTTCPMREPGVQRVKMTIEKGGGYKIMFR